AVVATAVGGTPEVLPTAADGGILVPSRDAAALAAAIVSLARDPATRAAIAAAGRRRLESAFPIDRMGGDYTRAYRRLLSWIMCGISGIVAIDGVLPPALRTAIGPMTAALRHRGPDGQGLFTDDVAALGHRRLAIIDREGGAQPISNEDGSCWIVFNGEIYNHRALRQRLLGLGHVFRTHSDTEAILHAY